MKQNFTQLPGVTDACVSIEDKTAKVSYDPEKFKPDEHVGKIKNRFDVTIKK